MYLNFSDKTNKHDCFEMTLFFCFKPRIPQEISVELKNSQQNV